MDNISVFVVIVRFLHIPLMYQYRVLFAVDSVPAMIGIIPKTDAFNPSSTTFIAFTSNVFAILGLRASYFLLAGAADMFRYLHYGLAAVPGLVGLKMIGKWWSHYEVSPAVSLLVIALPLGISIAASMIVSYREGPKDGATVDSE